MLAGVSAFSGMAQAQDATDSDGASAGPTAKAGRDQRMGFLSVEDREHLLRVRRQVLEANPDLKSEQESLRQEMKAAKGRSAGSGLTDKETLRGEFRAHREKMNAAMIKADPTVQPILDQIKAHREAASRRAAADEAGNP